MRFTLGYSRSFNLRKAIHRFYWDRWRPARNEREARNGFVKDNWASSARGAGGTPGTQYLDGANLGQRPRANG